MQFEKIGNAVLTLIQLTFFDRLDETKGMDAADYLGPSGKAAFTAGSPSKRSNCSMRTYARDIHQSRIVPAITR
jgi:hypothetical protein